MKCFLKEGHVTMLNLPTEGARILPSHPSKTVGGPHASLRVFVPRLPEILRQDSFTRRLRRGRNLMPALRRQGRRAALGLLRPHIQKERVRPAPRSSRMHFDTFALGSIQIDGSTYEHDVVIDRGGIRKRKKKRSKQFSEKFGQTTLSVEDEMTEKS